MKNIECRLKFGKADLQGRRFVYDITELGEYPHVICVHSLGANGWEDAMQLVLAKVAELYSIATDDIKDRWFHDPYYGGERIRIKA